MSDSLRPHGLQPTRLLHPWDFPGNSTGVGCHCLLRKLFNRVKLFASPWTMQSMEFSREDTGVGKPFPSLGDLPNPGIKPRSPTLQADFLPAEPQRSMTVTQGILASFSLLLSYRWLWTTRFQSIKGPQQVAPKQGSGICGISDGVTQDLLRSGPIEAGKY